MRLVCERDDGWFLFEHNGFYYESKFKLSTLTSNAEKTLTAAGTLRKFMFNAQGLKKWCKTAERFQLGFEFNFDFEPEMSKVWKEKDIDQYVLVIQ